MPSDMQSKRFSSCRAPNQPLIPKGKRHYSSVKKDQIEFSQFQNQGNKMKRIAMLTSVLLFSQDGGGGIQEEVQCSIQDHLESQNPNNQIKERYFLKGSSSLIHPAFGNHQNSIRLELSISLSRNQRYFNANLIYAQPNSFFRLPARLNLEVGVIFTPSHKPYAHNTGIFGVSQDLILPIFPSNHGNLYIGAGIGIYLKKPDSRVGSAFTFGERFFLGYMIKGFILELYWKHYSNGTLMLPNSGHDFGGLSVGYSF